MLKFSQEIAERYEKIYRYVFWTGYFAVLIAAFLPFSVSTKKVHLGPDVFEVRLDHLLHFAVYFLIGMYFLAGKILGLNLFSSKPAMKFLASILLLAAVTEMVQIWIPSRSFNIFDLVSNAIGVISGVLIAGLVKIKESSRREAEGSPKSS
jgi:VanZ family protein